MKKKILKGIGILLAIIVALVLIVGIAFEVSPRPSAMIINHLFDSKVVIKDKKKYHSASQQVVRQTNLTYTSKHRSNTFDLYYPKNTPKNSSLPVLIWLHGGGFVGGDKAGVKEFATRLVADTPIAVIAMNYEVAPAAQYPSQVKQVGELVKSLQSKKLKNLNLSQILFGGDSAGAQIALQYVTTQTNSHYARQMSMPQLIQPTAIKAAISYSGPVNLRQTAQQHTDNKFMKFFVNTVAWSLIGTKKWQNSPQLYQASLVKQVTKKFPPTYITDGNAFSFQEQGQALTKRLQQLDVPVQSLFFTQQKKQITHEYQFDYSTKEAQQCYAQTLTFVKKYAYN